MRTVGAREGAGAGTSSVGLVALRDVGVGDDGAPGCDVENPSNRGCDRGCEEDGSQLDGGRRDAGSASPAAVALVSGLTSHLVAFTSL